MMSKQSAYIVIDVGTGNVRVAVVHPDGSVLSVAREDIQYSNDKAYPNALYFRPDVLWKQIVSLAKQALLEAQHVEIKALTATSQREGIVVLDAKGQSLIGMPNIDHRGREWEDNIGDKSHVYALTGRYPTSLFSALKLVGLRERRADIWKEYNSFLSISDWVEYKLSGVRKYEHSQASETLLYDVEKASWSETLCQYFDLDSSLLPPLVSSGTAIGGVLHHVARELLISTEAVVVAGGGDTQLAIKSTMPSVEDVVIVSGTTTPIVKLVDEYVLDEKERTWTSRDIEEGRFVFEANAGVTGLNYQRLKEIFYPNEGYDVIEKELAQNKNSFCLASLGSLVADEERPLVKGGFIFPAPVTHELSRSCFVWATMLDIACSVAENYKILCSISPHQPDYIWACGGGLQSLQLRQLIANLTGKKIMVREGFQQSSAVGGALLCNEALGLAVTVHHKTEQVYPEEQERFMGLYREWKKARACFMQAC